MTKWFAYYKDTEKIPHFNLIASKDLPTAEMIAGELAVRNKSECIGVITAPLSFQQKDTI